MSQSCPGLPAGGTHGDCLAAQVRPNEHELAELANPALQCAQSFFWSEGIAQIRGNGKVTLCCSGC